MKGRVMLMTACLALAAGAGGYWWWTRPAMPAAPVSVPDAARAALGLRLAIESAGADDEAAATVRIFDVLAARRQTIAAAEQAAGRTWKGSSRAAVNAAAAVAPPANWVSLVTFTVTREGKQSTLAATQATATEPGSALFVMKTRPGDRITATAGVEGAVITSNGVTIAAIADARARTIAQGRVADLLGRADGLRAASSSLLAANADSPWGDYFRGVALELEGDRPAAHAAFERALANSGRGSEPSLGLLLRIERLQSSLP